MGPLLLLLAPMLDVLREGGTPANAGPAPIEQLVPLDVPSPAKPHPLSLGLLEPRALSLPSWKDLSDVALPVTPTRDPELDPLDMRWLFARPSEGFALEPRTAAPIDPYRFDRPAPLVEVRTSTWTSPWRERELHESLWQLRETSGVNLRLGVGRSSDCWWR